MEIIKPSDKPNYSYGHFLVRPEKEPWKRDYLYV
jgi:hypothetical protein